MKKPLPLFPIESASRNPFEAFLLLAATVQGIATLTRLAQPTSIEHSLPAGLRIIWGLLLAVGGLLTLAGIGWPGDPFTAVEIRRVGLVTAGCGTVVYGLAAAFLGTAGVAVAVYNLAFSAACFWRTIQITVRLRSVRQVLLAVRQSGNGDGSG